MYTKPVSTNSHKIVRGRRVLSRRRQNSLSLSLSLSLCLPCLCFFLCLSLRICASLAPSLSLPPTSVPPPDPLCRIQQNSSGRAPDLKEGAAWGPSVSLSHGRSMSCPGVCCPIVLYLNYLSHPFGVLPLGVSQKCLP